MNKQDLPEVLAREMDFRRNELPKIRAAGVAALQRLLKVARGGSGQCRYIAWFLLSLYNGYRFKMDLTDFRRIDQELFDDCIAVLKMDSRPEKEVHQYFENGQEIFEQLAKDWNVTDYLKLERQAKERK